MSTNNIMDKMHLVGQLKVVLETIISFQNQRTKIEQQINKLERKDKDEQSRSIKKSTD